MSAYHRTFPDAGRSLGDGHVSAPQQQIGTLFPRSETLQLLRLAELEGGGIRLTTQGHRFAESEVDERRQPLARYPTAHIPLAVPARRVLADRACHATCCAIDFSASGRSANGRRSADALVILSVAAVALTAESTRVTFPS